MEKKIYKSPVVITSNTIQGIVPLAAAAAAVGAAASSVGSVVGVGAALAGGYVAGRVVKAMEIRTDVYGLRTLRKVCD